MPEGNGEAAAAAATLTSRWTTHLAPTYAAPSLLLARGEGAHVWDAAGRRYLDFIAGLAVNATGHAHPRVVAAIQQQAARLVHVSNLYATEPVLALAERLKALTLADKAFFCNSGAEANELALKTVRRHAHAQDRGEAVVLALTGSFHGRTTATVALTGQPRYQRGFGPLPGGIVHVPSDDEAALEDAFARHDVAGAFFEPIQGESGVRPLSPAFVRRLSRLCGEHDALLVADEVQTGIGRTGRFLAQEWYGVRADVTTLAKGIASGVPMGAVMLSEHAARLLSPGDHGCTFGGNPLAAAAAMATLDVLEEERLVENAWRTGAHLRVRLMEEVAGLDEVRGLGLLVGAQFAAPHAKRIQADAQAAGLLVNAVGEHVIRLAPPLIVDEVQCDEAVAVLAKLGERGV